MISIDLHDFIEKASASGFIGTQDVDLLQQDILKTASPAGSRRRPSSPSTDPSRLPKLGVGSERSRGRLRPMDSDHLRITVDRDALWLTSVLEMSGPMSGPWRSPTRFSTRLARWIPHSSTSSCAGASAPAWRPSRRKGASSGAANC